jgi:hypothetical protein
MMLKDIDMGFKNIFGVEKQASVLYAVVGVQGDKGQEARGESATNALLAAVHEYGSEDGHIPQRSFMRSTLDDKQSEYLKRLDELGEMALSGKVSVGGGTIKGQLFLLGEKYRKDVLKKMDSGIKPELTKSTIARRRGESGQKNTTPLEDTKIMRNSISVVMESGAHATD